MFGPIRAHTLGLILAIPLSACSESVYVVITIDVPSALEQRVQASTRTAQLVVGRNCIELGNSMTVGKRELNGYTFSLEGRTGGTTTVCVEARDAQGLALARGTSTVDFRDKTSGVTVTLSAICKQHSDCSDGLFCTGEEACEDGTCALSVPPCVTADDCAAATCDEENDRCNVSLAHHLCPPGQACNQHYGCRDCAVLPYSLFCRPGEQCIDDASEPAYGECVAKPGWWCDASACEPCGETTRCGPECVACTSPTGVCGGPDVGCVRSSCTGAPHGARCSITTAPDTNYDICVHEVCITPGTAVYSDGVDRAAACRAGEWANEWMCATAGPTFALGDTGLRACYNATQLLADCSQAADVSCAAVAGPFCGQDGQHGWDTSHNPDERLSRTLHNPTEPTVFDHVTGLEWQGCAAGINGTDCGDGGLAEFEWLNALSYCNALVWGAITDWRLPDRYELRSLVDVSLHPNRTLDEAAFPGTQPDRLWSSTADTHAANPFEQAWHVDFAHGETQTSTKALRLAIRCVRGSGSVHSEPRFTRTSPTADEPIVADAATGLTWQGCPSGFRGTSCTAVSGTALGNWPEGLTYCRDLDWSGYTDWRLANIVELDSLVDVNPGASMAFDAAAFPGTVVWDEDSQTEVSWYLSSTTLVSRTGDSTQAYAVQFDSGVVDTLEKVTDSAIRCVRGGE